MEKEKKKKEERAGKEKKKKGEREQQGGKKKEAKKKEEKDKKKIKKETSNAKEKLYVYLIPAQSELKARLYRYYEESLDQKFGGHNDAHDFLPHATLVQIILQSQPESPEALYAQIGSLLASCLANEEALWKLRAPATVTIKGLIDKTNAEGRTYLCLGLASQELNPLLEQFKKAAKRADLEGVSLHSVKVQDPNRYHISLAYGFEGQYRTALKDLQSQCGLGDLKELGELLLSGSGDGGPWFNIALLSRKFEGQPPKEWMTHYVWDLSTHLKLNAT